MFEDPSKEHQATQKWLKDVGRAAHVFNGVQALKSGLRTWVGELIISWRETKESEDFRILSRRFRN